MKTKNEITSLDIELIGTTLRGLLRDPDLLSDADSVKGIELLEFVGNA